MIIGGFSESHQLVSSIFILKIDDQTLSEVALDCESLLSPLGNPTLHIGRGRVLTADDDDNVLRV